jgi:hypothetical protein
MTAKQIATGLIVAAYDCLPPFAEAMVVKPPGGKDGTSFLATLFGLEQPA